MTRMAVGVKKLDVHSGDVVEIEGRRYDVVPDRQGGLTLEPAITVFVAERGASRAPWHAAGHAGGDRRPVRSAAFRRGGVSVADIRVAGERVVFDSAVWDEDVERFDRGSRPT